jgi:hypothetical protein
MTSLKFKAQLESRVKKLLPANSPPRRLGSQLLLRARAPHADSQLSREEYSRQVETSPVETPRTRRDKLKIVFWIAIVLLSFAFMFYFRIPNVHSVFGVWMPLRISSTIDLPPSRSHVYFLDVPESAFTRLDRSPIIGKVLSKAALF